MYNKVRSERVYCLLISLTTSHCHSHNTGLPIPVNDNVPHTTLSSRPSWRGYMRTCCTWYAPNGHILALRDVRVYLAAIVRYFLRDASSCGTAYMRAYFCTARSGCTTRPLLVPTPATCSVASCYTMTGSGLAGLLDHPATCRFSR